MNQKKIVLRGETALVIAVIINSLGVLLMLQSGSGISAISSVPYAFHQVMPKLSLGTWTYLFQGFFGCGVDDHASQVRAVLPVQFCGRIRIRGDDGRA